MNARQVVLDTETTGLEPSLCHRIIEIGAVEILNRRLTGEYFHVYINPERDIDEGAMAVHGLTREFLKDKPTFSKVIHDLLNFLNGDELIIHNAPFDLKFLNEELRRLQHPMKIVENKHAIIDTLTLAREKHPGQRNNLDALCKRYNVDTSKRTLHGALLDARLLASVYLAMTSGQHSLFESSVKEEKEVFTPEKSQKGLEARERFTVISVDEAGWAAHQNYLERLKKENGGRCAWKEESN